MSRDWTKEEFSELYVKERWIKDYLQYYGLPDEPASREEAAKYYDGGIPLHTRSELQR